MNTALMFGSGENAVGTPLDFYEALSVRVGGFAADMAADSRLFLHPDWYGPDHTDPGRRDSLTIDWPTAGPVFLNPIYSDPEEPCSRRKDGTLTCKKLRCPKRRFHIDIRIPGCIDFVRKAAEQRLRGVETWALLAARTDNEWFHTYIYNAAAKRWRPGVKAEFIPGRLHFRRLGLPPAPAPFPSMVVIFRPTKRGVTS